MNDALISKRQVVTTPQKVRINYGFHLIVTNSTLEVLTNLLYLSPVTTDRCSCCFAENLYSLHRSRHMGRDNFETISNRASGYERRCVQHEVEKVFLRGELIVNGTNWLSRKCGGKYHKHSASRVF